MNDPFAPNVDIITRSLDATNVAIGLTEPTDGSAPELVLALERGRTSIAAFLDRAQTEQIVGRLMRQMQEMGWMQ